MSRPLMLTVCISAILFSSSGFQGPRYYSFPPMEPVTRLEIKAIPDREPVRVIEDPVEIKRIVEFVDANRHDWGGWATLTGIPIPYVEVDFYNGSEFLGHFGVGDEFLMCQRDGIFSAKSCSYQESRQFLRLVGLPDYKVQWKPRSVDPK